MKNHPIRGQVIDATTRRALGNLRVEAWDRDLLCDDLLGSAVTDADGAFTIEFDASAAPDLFDRCPDIYFKVFRCERLLADTRSQVLWSAKDPSVRIVIPIRDPEDPCGNDSGVGPFKVDGLVTTEAGVAVSNVRVEVWDHQLGGEKLLATGVTAAGGTYLLHYDAGHLVNKTRADLSVRILDPRKQGAEIARSEVFYQASPHLTVNLTVKADSVTRPSEYQRLLDAAQPILGERALGDLDAKEVEYVANRIRWDARTVAMAAQATRLSAATKIPAAHYYALMRTGLPGDADTLHRLPDSSVERGLALAIADGVIANDQPIETTLNIHRAHAAAALQKFAPTVAVSNLGDMLALSLDQARTATFLDVYHATADRPGELWSALAQRGFDQGTISRLQTDGKLGYLTRQNAPLVRRLYDTAQISAAEDLPRAGLYKAEAWKSLIGHDTPDQISVDAYAAGLAAQVNLSYPTLVVAEMVRRGEVPIDQPLKAGEGEVAAFLQAGHEKHTIGVEPISRWTGYEQLSSKARAGARLVERLYQLSPSNESMVALHQLGLHSALDIISQPRETFLLNHGDAFPNQAEAALVYQKAQEIHTFALNVATLYLSYRGAPNVYAMTGLRTRLPLNSSEATPAGSPKLEELLQNMDYCACDACKSVQSPAAYFVELLQFIDVPNVPAGKSNPQEVLFQRRPDLQDLLLSCENTNVALPYIDLVNEILEHFIIHGSLAAFHGYNMRDDSKTADLLADPEYVTNAAYDKTKAEVYPHGLPFDMPLAALRLLMQAWDTTLSDAMRVLRTISSARREMLGLNSGEYRSLTDTGFKALPVYFGEPAATTLATLNATIADGKTFSRRMEITYEDLVDLLRTRFINPHSVLVPLLQPLKIDLEQLQSFYTEALDAAGLNALLPAGLDPAVYGGDILQWLRDHRAQIMGLITLTDVSAGAEECNFATVELRFALPDDSANRLTELEYQKLHRFIRLWKKLGWSIEVTDQVVTSILGIAPEALTSANLDATFTALVARLANFVTLLRRLKISSKRIGDWLPIWDGSQTRTVRQETLAHLLRLGTTDLVHLSEITGIDPLADDLEADAPSILGFLDAAQALKTARLKVTDVDYLLRHRDDSVKLAPIEAALLRDLKVLRDDLTAIAVDLDAPRANADVAYALSKMALVYDATVVDRFIGLISGSISYEASLVTVEEVLPSKLTDADAHLGLDPFAKVLTHAGILSAATADALRAASDTLVLPDDVTVIGTEADLNAFIAAFKVAVQGLVDAGQGDLHALDLDYPELKVVYDAIAAIADPEEQAKALTDHILPALRGRLRAVSLRTTLSTLLKIDQPLVDVLTKGPAVMHAVSEPTVGVLQDFLRLDAPVALNANQTYALHLDPPSTDDYILYVGAPAGTAVTLTIDGVAVIPLTLLGVRKEIETAAALPLRAGVLTPAALTLAGLPAGATAELRWRTKGMAKAPVPASRIYADAHLADARASLIRLEKAAMLLRAIPFTPRELHHLAASNADTAGYLNDLDVAGAITPAALHALWIKVAWLAWFSQLKAVEPDENTWVSLLEQPGQLTPNGALVLAAAAGWTDQDVTDVLGQFGLVLADLSALHVFRKVKEAVDFIVATGQTASDLIAWTVASPDAALITTIKESLRSHQDDLSWRTTMQSVNDALRNQRRDALVNYILHHQSPDPDIDTADKLYEYFLIDVAMDACMLTSRIRQALSTVQLFITRCLMNLEPGVTPSSIRADQWAWMKRYRVWEANRKIFLYPENWLEPELRDNKSPFFRDLESDLLKSDITDALAEDAYFSYLKKLDEVARLDILGCYLQERQPGNPDDDILHVFGRTNGNTHQYYYRRYEYGYWTPWEKMALNIEGDLLLPMVWKGQLFVFWLTVLHKPEGGTSSESPTVMATHEWASSAKLTAEITLAWGEYYQGKWTSPKSSELKDPIRVTGLTKFELEKVVVAARLEKPSPDVSERLVIMVLYLGSPIQFFTLVLTSKNAAPTIRNGSDQDLFLNVEVFNYFLLWQPQVSSVLDANRLKEPGRVFTVSINQPSGASSTSLDEVLFTKTSKLDNGFRVRPLMHPIENQWDAPLFYSDERSVLFINPKERVRLVLRSKGYFWNDISSVSIPPDKIKIPPLYEKPVLKDPLGPVSHPLESGININYERIISDNTRFTYGGVVFDAFGIVKQEVGR